MSDFFLQRLPLSFPALGSLESASNLLISPSPNLLCLSFWILLSDMHLYYCRAICCLLLCSCLNYFDSTTFLICLNQYRWVQIRSTGMQTVFGWMDSGTGHGCPWDLCKNTVVWTKQRGGVSTLNVSNQGSENLNLKWEIVLLCLLKAERRQFSTHTSSLSGEGSAQLRAALGPAAAPACFSHQSGYRPFTALQALPYGCDAMVCSQLDFPAVSRRF